MALPATFIPDDAPASFEPDVPDSFIEDPPFDSVAIQPRTTVPNIMDVTAVAPQRSTPIDIASEPNPSFSNSLRAILPSDLGPEQSMLGITPEEVPSGANISETLGLPRIITTPASAIAKTAAGLGQFLTSPSGAAQTVTAAVPGVGLAQKAHWVYDMASGAGEATGDLAAKLEKLAKTPEAVTQDDWQAVAEDSANAIAMLYGAGKLTSHQVQQATGVRAPLGRMTEPARKRFAKDLAFELSKQQPVTTPVDMAARENLGLPPRAPGQAVLSELQRTKELIDRAIQEAQNKIVVPGQTPALELLKTQGIEIVPESRTTAERIQGGGGAPYGKVSYMREAEAPTTERTQNALQIQKTNEEVLRQQESQVGLPQVGTRNIEPEIPAGIPAPEGTARRGEIGVENEAAKKAVGSALETGVKAWELSPVENIQRHEAAGYTKGISNLLLESRASTLRRLGKSPNNPDITNHAWQQAFLELIDDSPELLTRKEFVEGRQSPATYKRDNSRELAQEHKEIIQEALKDGKPVPPEVLSDYPELAKLTPPPPKPPAPSQGAIDTAIGTIEDLQKRIRGTGENLGMNVPAALLDTALEVARLTLKAGKTVTEAVEAAIAHIRKNASLEVKKSLDDAKTREILMSQLRVTPENPIRVEGVEEKMRKSAERAANSDEVPKPVREQIATAPESQYKVQPQEDVNTVLDAMTDAQLAAVPKESNIYVGSRLKLSKRLFDQGKYDEGYNVFQEVSEAGTDFGQNINQFKMLKGVTPFDVVKVINQGLKKSGRDPLTKPQEQKVAKSSNESIEANNKLKKAQDDWMKNPTDANAKLADEAADAAHKSDLETQKLVNQYTPKSWPKMLKAFVQGNPLTPISQVANVVGNVLGAGMETGSRGVGSMLDQIRTMFTGGERKLAVSPVSGPRAAGSGLARGAKQGVEVLKRGSGDVVKGEFRQTLRPLRALQTAFAKNPDIPTVKGKVPFNERVRLVVEGTFGISPEVMLRLLSAADRPSYEAARSRLINEQSKLKNIPAENRSMALKFPELFFDRNTLKLIQDESLNAVFQSKSLGISYLESLIKNNGGDWADLGFTMLVAPYRLTPWNLVGRTLIYNPLIAAFRTAYYASKGNIRQAELNAGRMIVGGMLYGAGYFLYKNGLIGPSLDSRDETKKERLLSGEVIPPNHVNVSGLKRMAKGGDPKFKAGDETIDLTRGGGAAGAILSSVANIGRDFEKKPEGSSPFIASLIKNSTLEQASFTINQSFLKGVTGILDAIRDRNLEPYMNSVEGMFLNVGTPNTLSTLSRASRKYAPDLKDPSQIKAFQNLARERFGVAGLDDYLPLKRDLWGKPMLQTPEGRNAILYHLFDISKNKQVTSDPVSLELYDLWRTTAKREVIPSIPERQITVANKTHALEPKQYERLVELVGQQRRIIMDALVVNPRFQNLDSDNKIKVIDNAYRHGATAGKALFIRETPSTDLKEANKPKAGFKTAK